MMRFPKNSFSNYFKLLLMLLLGIISNSSIAQMDNALKDVMHHAPNAASLGKYGDIPVGYHTGTANISIPLYSLSEGSVGTSVSLSYHSSGIRVQETASWAGLGWALNAGGMITRTIMNAPDDGCRPNQLTGYYKDYGHGLPKFNPDWKTSHMAGLNNEYDFVASGLMDAEPDLFSFNFNGYSGKFIFDDQRQIKVIPEQDIKIEVVEGACNCHAGALSFETWIITTPDGTKYYFGGTNATESTASTTGQPLQASDFDKSSWYLYRIESADGLNSVDFNYADEQYSFFNIRSEQYMTGATPVPGSPITSTPSGVTYTYPLQTVIQGKRLTSIETDNQKIIFNTGALRQDLSGYSLLYQNDYTNDGAGNNGAYTLGGIEVQDKAGNCIKKINLDQSYANTSVSTQALPATNYKDNSDKKRLLLNGVKEYDCSNNLLKEHSFTYNNPNGLPRRVSAAQDHWGYYNGANGNRTLIPSTAHANSSASREPSGTVLGYGAISSITYPTKGTTTFTFEPHDYVDYQSNCTDQTLLSLSTCGFYNGSCSLI